MGWNLCSVLLSVIIITGIKVKVVEYHTANRLCNSHLGIVKLYDYADSRYVQCEDGLETELVIPGYLNQALGLT